jgi:hypothetical protein
MEATVEAMAAKRTKDDGVMLGLRLDADDAARLDALADRMLLGSRHALARACLLLGLEAVERDPAILLGQAKGRKAPRR